MINNIKDELQNEISKEMPRKKAIVILCIAIIVVVATIIMAIKFDFVRSLLLTELILPIGIALLIWIAVWIYKKIRE